MTSLIGNLQTKQDRLHDKNGKFTEHPKCDGCGKPCTEHFTDERACGGGDGPGFYLCGRKYCQIRLDRVEEKLGVEGLKTWYTIQRTKNNS